MQATVLVELDVEPVAEQAAFAQVRGYVVIDACICDVMCKLGQRDGDVDKLVAVMFDRGPIGKQLREAHGLVGAVAQRNDVARTRAGDTDAADDPLNVLHLVE